MMSTSIRFRVDTVKALEAKGRFGETHDDVLRRMLGLGKRRNGRAFYGIARKRRAKKNAK